MTYDCWQFLHLRVKIPTDSHGMVDRANSYFNAGLQGRLEVEQHGIIVYSISQQPI